MKFSLFHFVFFNFSYHKPSNSDNCNGCSAIKCIKKFTTPSFFQRFQICPDTVYLHLTFENCIIPYTEDDPCIIFCCISLSN